MRILLVEDSKTAVQLVKGLLAEEDKVRDTHFDISVATTLKEATEIIDEQSFDLILLDLTLPDSHGLDTIDTIVQMVPAMAVVVLTSSQEESLGIHALKRGVQDFLVKDETYSKVLVRSVRYAYQRKKSEQEIRDAREIAEFATLSKSQFITSLSHELRTPLNAIIGFSEMMASHMHGELNSKYAEYAKDINDSGKYLHGLIGTVLDISKIEAQKAEFTNEVVDLKTSISSAVTKTSFLAKAGNVDISIVNVDDIPKIRGDTIKLKQVFVNLLGNAIKFSPDGGKVNITVSREEDCTLVLAIKDQGIGIPEDQIKKVQSPFNRSTLSRNMNIEGTGLGLPLSKSLVEAHQGTLRVESEVGKGTTVFISFPPERVI